MIFKVLPRHLTPSLWQKWPNLPKITTNLNPFWVIQGTGAMGMAWWLFGRSRKFGVRWRRFRAFWMEERKEIPVIISITYPDYLHKWPQMPLRATKQLIFMRKIMLRIRKMSVGIGWISHIVLNLSFWNPKRFFFEKWMVRAWMPLLNLNTGAFLILLIIKVRKSREMASKCIQIQILLLNLQKISRKLTYLLIWRVWLLRVAVLARIIKLIDRVEGRRKRWVGWSNQKF